MSLGQFTGPEFLPFSLMAHYNRQTPMGWTVVLWVPFRPLPLLFPGKVNPEVYRWDARGGGGGIPWVERGSPGWDW